jgi:prohibitin 2
MDNRGVDISELSRQFKKIIIPVIVIILIIIVIKYRPWVIVQTGTVGIKLRLGKVTGAPLPEGPHPIIPFMDHIELMNVKEQKARFDTDAASRDLQNIAATLEVNYKIDPVNADKVFKEVRQDYERIQIAPSVQEVMKSVTAQYTAEQLITQRQEVSNAIKDRLIERLHDDNIIVMKIAIVNLSFSKQYMQSIEDKQIAAQMALKAENELRRIKIEAEQKITQAKAEAEALRLQKENISPDLLELRRIEASIMAIKKWDGRLPTITSGALPFIEVESLQKENRMLRD